MGRLDEQFLVFRASPTAAGILSSVSVVVVFLALAVLVRPTTDTEVALSVIIYCSLGIGVFFLVIYFRIGYFLSDTSVVIVCGPIHWIIPLASIEVVERRNLTYHPTSTGWKLPGFALFRIYYTGNGNVSMCATRVCKDIILLRTRQRTYGITPDDASSFLTALRERMK